MRDDLAGGSPHESDYAPAAEVRHRARGDLGRGAMSEHDQERDETPAGEIEGASAVEASPTEPRASRRMPKKGRAATRKKKPNVKSRGGEGKAGSKDTGNGRGPGEALGERYLCVHCGHKFVQEDPTRCPSCMRKGGLERLEGDATRSKPWLLPALAVGLVAAVALGYVLWSRSTPDAVSGQEPLAPLSYSELRGYLREHDADGEYADLFEADDAVEGVAEHATGDGPVAKAESLVAYIRDRAAARAFVPWAMDTPRATPPRGASETAGRLAEDGAEGELYPLEVAVAAVAALREAGVDAMVTEIWAFPGDRVPPDPSGFLGYFGVAVYEGEVGEGEPRVLDPYGGHGTEPESSDYRVLRDTQAVAAAMGLAAAYELVHENDPVRALDRSRRALRLDERAPYLRTIQGKVLIAGAGVQQGIEELQAAAQIRPDAPRRTNLAGVFVVTGDVDQAAREVASALERFPDYAIAHATLAAIHLAQGENELARTELVAAERLESRLLNLPMLWANYFIQAGDQAQAVRKAREAVERNPNNWETRFQAARLYRMAGQYGAMRREARRILELVQPEQRAMVRQRILELLGPTALEEEDDDDGFDDLEADDLDDEPLDEDDLGGGGLRLESELFGGADESGPSLLDEELGGGGFGGSLGGGLGGGLRLGGSGGGPRLRLSD